MYAIDFNNNNASITKPWVTFIQATQKVATGYQLVGPALAATAVIRGNKQKLVNGQSYSIVDIGTTLQMGPESWQGHMYISDAALTPPTAGGLPVDMAYTLTTDTGCYQYLEFAGSNSTASIDITYINWYALPLQIKSTSQSRGAPRTGASLSTLPARLAALSGNNPATKVTNSSGQTVRVISPNAGPNWQKLYHSFSDYLRSVFTGSAQRIRIDNIYSGVGSPPSPDFKQQTYKASSVNYDGQTLTIQGTTSLLGNFTMSSKMNWQQFSSVIYMAVMSYSWSYAGTGSIPGASNAYGNTGDNNVFSAVSRDLMCGFAFGFVGSAKYGAQTSKDWMGAPATGVFSQIQPSHPYYNPWANAIAAYFTDVYTFPFNDFLTVFPPEINVKSGDKLTVTLLKTTTGS